MKSNILGEKNKWQKVSDKEVFFQDSNVEKVRNDFFYYLKTAS
jgi:hypothetical protein